MIDRLAAALDGLYRIERLLGEGGMATVYLAHDVKHDRKVAIKVLRPELAAVIGAERFLAEIKTTANLQHPHILPLHDSGEAVGTVFYVMPFIEGESLRDRLDRERQLPVDDAVRIAGEVAAALDYAHRHGVVHRDIKPENILLHDGSALVADFGIALAVSRLEGGTRMTETGMSLGTPHYMSPEQAMGEREVTPKADIYALGCVLYEMLAGEPPFTGPTAQAIVARVVTEEPRVLAGQRKTIPPNVEAAVRTALQKLPADRFASAAAFADALGDRTYGIGGPAPEGVGPSGSAAPARVRALNVTLAAFAAVAMVLAGWGWLTVRSLSHRPPTWQYVTLGDSATLTTTYLGMALSPDGSMLVFKDDRQNGLLWVKRRDRLAPTPIPGTERAQNPVFSPDGQWIAFSADRHLKKVRVSGGATVTLADSVGPEFSGVAWLDDGTIVYGTPEQTRLKRVSDAGGPSTLILTEDSLGGGGIGLPVALPGAHGVLFQYCSSGCVSTGVHVLDLRTGQQKELLPDAVSSSYLPDGRLMWVRLDGVAMAAPFDLERLEITGEATPVLEGIEVQPFQGFALVSWSTSGSLVYARASLGSSDYTVVKVKRDGATTPIDPDWHGAVNSLTISPSGDRIATAIGQGSSLNIWIKPLGPGPATRLTFGNQDRRPAWSPDGKEIAFIRDSASTSMVFGHPADGTGPDRLLAHIDRMIQEVTWSPDGRWLVLRTDNTAYGAADLVGVRTDGDTTAVPLVATSFSELHPAVSPDGRWLAYMSNESGINEVYVRPFPETGSGRSQVSNGGGSSPVWSPSGRALYYLDGGGSVVAARLDTRGAFRVLDLTPMFNASGYQLDAFHTTFAVTPDDSTFLFVASRRVGRATNGPQLVWVDDWFTDLEQRLST
ncbi:MAG: protein kinase [Gemmatimonadetes bacterium]|nr:protein kinase [Gemmatimonadota bacterium]